MAVQVFGMDARDFRKLKKFYKRAPQQFSRVTASVLNAHAFGNRRESLKIINQKMTVRSPKFIKGSMRINKARIKETINRQFSEFGSIEKKSKSGKVTYSGLVEQETGESPQLNRTASKRARRGSWGNVMFGPARLKPANVFDNPDNYPGKNPQQRAVAMLQILNRKKGRKKPFVIKGHRKFKSGIYTFHRKKIRRLQTFGEEYKIKRVKWLSGGSKEYFSKTDITQEYAKAMRFVLKIK